MRRTPLRPANCFGFLETHHLIALTIGRQNAIALGGKGSLSIKPGKDGGSKAAPAGKDAVAEHQRRQVRANQKSTSHHYSSQEDSVPGFRIEPPAVARGGPAAMQTAGFGSTWYGRSDTHKAVSRTSSSVRVSHQASQRSRGTDLHPSASAARNANSRYNRLDVAEPANAMDRPGSSHKKDGGMRDRDTSSAVSFVSSDLLRSGRGAAIQTEVRPN